LILDNLTTAPLLMLSDTITHHESGERLIDWIQTIEIMALKTNKLHLTDITSPSMICGREVESKTWR